MKKHHFLLLIFLLSGICVIAQNSGCDALLKDGKEKYNAGNYAKALEYFNMAKKLKCTNAQSWIGKCNAKLKPTKPAVTKKPQQATASTSEITMVHIPGGTFTMGCTSEQGADCGDNEKPAHQVSVSNFYIGKYEVTQKQWRDVMGSNPSYFKGDNLPVEQVSWEDVQTFINKLNAKTEKNYRLPTEAEWEYAARGGQQSAGYKYSGSNMPEEVAWHGKYAWDGTEWKDQGGGNSENKTHAVGTKQANELGIYDMSGNVYEWCYDWYGAYSSDAQSNPTGASTGSNRVARGGNWYYSAGGVRSSDRNGNAPDFRIINLGFRLARSSK